MEEKEILFEDLFKGLLAESRHINIVYDFQERHYKEDTFYQYEVVTINGHSIYGFKRSLQNLGKEGMRLLNEELANIPYEDRPSFLETIKEELLGLKGIVQDDKIIHEENEYGPREEHAFKSFTNAAFIPFSEKRTGGNKKSILRKASPYASEWLEVIDETARKIDFIVNQQELLPEPKEAIKDKNTITLFYSWQMDDEVQRKQIWKTLHAAEKYYNKRKNIAY